MLAATLEYNQKIEDVEAKVAAWIVKFAESDMSSTQILCFLIENEFLEVVQISRWNRTSSSPNF